ncbi:MAG: membrane peptidoglycan carboxypeptidase [Paracoccaceae bacterium]|jgi:membrane peptidoglycan carboxypeptidase
MFGRRNKKVRPWFFKRKGFWIFCLICLVILGVGAFYGNKELDPYREIANAYDLERVGEKEEMSFIHDRAGSEIGTMFVENRFSISLNEVPPVFVNAVLAQEDQRFYEHRGVDWTGVGRAAYLNAKSGSVTQGAGTITMQLARKSFDLLNEAKRLEWTGYERKIVEAFVAIRIEEHFDEQLRIEYPGDPERRKKAVKAKVLEMYLNLVPFGSGYYGVRSAALGYFGKEPKDLTISECASIVACLKNPKRISPLRSLEENKTNRDHVLRRMALEEMITEGERDQMMAKPVVINPKPILRGKSYLYELVAEQARNLVGEEALSRGGYTIRTTIDAKVQRAAEEGLGKHLKVVEEAPNYKHAKYSEYDREQGPPKYLQGATLMMDHETGEVIAHVGGRDFAHSQYDFIENGRRPLGTGFFPFVYASAFENGRHPATLVLDEQMDVRKLQVGGDLEGVVAEWGMEVIHPKYEGLVTSRRALGVSKIAATVELGQQVGLPNVLRTGEAFGFDLPPDKLLNRMLVGFDKVSMSEVVSAYSTFPRGGTRIAAKKYIREIRDIDGKIVYPIGGNAPGVSTKPVCSEATAFQVHSILNDVMKTGNLREVSKGLTTGLLLGGGKSGTPYGFSDAWMAGYNSRITCAVWVGFYEGGRKAIHGTAFAKDVAFPIWKDMMNVSQPSFAGREILPPKSVEKISICRVSGMRPTRYCNESVENPETGAISFRSTSYQEYLRQGEEMGICAVHGGGIDLDILAEKDPMRETLNTIPIKAQAPLLLGFDPYRSETPTLGMKDDAEAWAMYANVLIVEDQVRGEREALLKLSRPPRFELPPAELLEGGGE